MILLGDAEQNIFSCRDLELSEVNQTRHPVFLHWRVLRLFFLGVSLRGVCPLDLDLTGVSGLGSLLFLGGEDLRTSGRPFKTRSLGEASY